MATYTESTVGQLVVERPARARVFEKLGIDYCCGGKKPLGQACAEKKLDVTAVVAALQKADSDRAAAERDWGSSSLTELANHIESTHHAYLKSELPRLDFLTHKVAAVHGPHNPKLVQVREIFIGLKAEMDSHMQKEEQILFPLCRKLEQGGAGAAASHCGSVQNPIRVMIMEHDHAGNALEQMRALTDDYTPPAEACNTYRAMLDALAVLEHDMHQHVHKENNILFPKAVRVEAELKG